MKNRNIIQTEYQGALANPMSPVLSSDNPLTEYSFFVNPEPTPSSGRLYIDYEIEAKQDILYYHRKSGNQIFYYKKNRWLPPHTTWSNVTHIAWASVSMRDVWEYFNTVIANVSDLWYVEQWYNWTSPLAIKVYGWVYSLYSENITIPDTTFNLLANSTYNIVLDDNTSVFVAKQNDSSISVNEMPIADIVTWVDSVLSITDKRPELFRYRLSNNFTLNEEGELTVTNLAIDTEEINNWAVTNSKLATSSVGTANLIDRSITSIKIQENPELSGNVTITNWYLKLSSLSWWNAWAGEANIFVKELLGVATPHFKASNWNEIPLWVNPVVSWWSAVVVWPITRWTNISSFVVSDVSVVELTSMVFQIIYSTGTLNATTIESEITNDWEITFTAYTMDWELSIETGFQFYYSIRY